MADLSQHGSQFDTSINFILDLLEFNC